MKTNKFQMFRTFGDALEYLKMNFAALSGTSVLVAILHFLFSTVLLVTLRSVVGISGIYKYNSAINYTGYSFETLVISTILFIPVFVLLSVFMAVYIKIIDDSYENRDIHYGAQIKFAFRKSGKLILSSLITYVPVTVVYMLLSMSAEIIGKSTPVFISIIYFFTLIFFVFINQSIIIEDVTAMQAIGRSFKVMKYNILRYIGFSLLMGIAIFASFGLIGYILKGSMMIIIIAVTLLVIAMFLLMPLPIVFTTLLFKSVPHRPYDYKETAEHYIDSDDLYFEHDERSNDGLYTDDKDLYYDE